MKLAGRAWVVATDLVLPGRNQGRLLSLGGQGWITPVQAVPLDRMGDPRVAGRDRAQRPSQTRHRRATDDRRRGNFERINQHAAGRGRGGHRLMVCQICRVDRAVRPLHRVRPVGTNIMEPSTLSSVQESRRLHTSGTAMLLIVDSTSIDRTREVGGIRPITSGSMNRTHPGSAFWTHSPARIE
jgi:hypothetical protein